MGFSIGEVSQAVGLAPQTLRLWERERLIKPRRTDRGYRVYTEPDVERLREIKQLSAAPGAASPNGSAPGDSSGAPGERLRRLRIRAHKTLKEVSAATGLSI